VRRGVARGLPGGPSTAASYSRCYDVLLPGRTAIPYENASRERERINSRSETRCGAR